MTTASPGLSAMRLIIGTNWSLRQPGGIPSHIALLTRGLAQRGIEHCVVNPDDRFQSGAWKGFALLRGLGSPDRGRVLLAGMRMRDLADKLSTALSEAPEPYHLIHAHDALFGRVALQSRLPVVLTVHGPLTNETRMFTGPGQRRILALMEETERLAYAGARLIIAVDQGQKGRLVTEFGVVPDKVRVIQNAVDTEAFRPRARSVEVRYFLAPRRLVPKNGVAVAIEAFATLRDTAAQLWIAGNGPEEQPLRALADRLFLSQRVRFLGSVNQQDMPGLAGQALGVIIPSVPTEGVVEATSIAALEGMSAGRPVFASAIGGLAEIIRHGETGYLFEAGQPRALEALLRQALDSDGADLSHVGANARRYVERHHSPEAWMEKTLAVYRQAAST
ncbi:MAG: glycosyltransferase family 4 protein [Bacillota bacterium]